MRFEICSHFRFLQSSSHVVSNYDQTVTIFRPASRKVLRGGMKLLQVNKIFRGGLRCRNGTGQDFLDPTGKIQNLRQLTGYGPARSTVFFY